MTTTNPLHDKKYVRDLFAATYPHGKIEPEEVLSGGFTKAVVWSVFVDGQRPPRGFAVAKISVPEQAQKDVEHHVRARANRCIQPYIPEIFYPLPGGEPPLWNGYSYVLYELAHHTTREMFSLAQAIDRRHHYTYDIGEQVRNLLDSALECWYADMRNYHIQPAPFPIVDAFTNAFNTGDPNRFSTLAADIAQHFRFDSSVNELLFLRSDGSEKRSERLPSPVFYFLRPQLWLQNSVIRIQPIPSHGDLQGSNLICNMPGWQFSKDVPSLIDLSDYNEQGLPFVDLAVLEFDILKNLWPKLSANREDDWEQFTHLVLGLTRADFARWEPKRGGLAGDAWSMIKPIRTYVQQLVGVIEKHATGIGDQAMRAWWLSMIVAGMRAARRGNETTHPIRSLGLFYAAAALKNLLATCTMDRIDDKQAVLKWFDEYGLAEQHTPAVISNRSLTQMLPLEPKIAQHYPWAAWDEDFVGRSDELDILKSWIKFSNPIMIIQALGGQGKTALSWYWFHLRAKVDFPEVMGRFWWSFYDSNSKDMLDFIHAALTYISGYSVAEFSKLSRSRVEDMFIEALQTQPYLFVLDGFERILRGYNTNAAGRKPDEEVIERAQTAEELHDFRSCIVREDAQFLLRLRRVQLSKILITTRLIPADLEKPDSDHELLGGVDILALQGLSSDAVLRYMQDHRGVKGDPNQITAFMERFGNNGLVMKIITARICHYLGGQYQFERWFEDNKEQIDLHSPEFKQRRTHILEFAFHDLEEEHRKFLQSIAAFDHAVNSTALAYMFFNMFAIRYLDLPPNIPTEKALESLEDDLRKLEVDRFRFRHRKTKNAVASLVRVEQDIRDLQARLAEHKQSIEQLKDATRLTGYPPRVKEAIRRAINALADRGLLLSDPEHDLYDLHPIVREYANEELTGESRKKVYGLTVDYFEQWSKRLPPQINEFQQLLPLQDHFVALLEMGDLKRAANLYDNQLATRLHYDFEAYAKVVEFLSPLFKGDLQKLPSDIEGYRRFTNAMANALSMLDRKPEAQKLRLLMIDDALAKNWASDVCIEMSNYAEELRSENHLYAATQTFELAIELAQAADEKLAEMVILKHVIELNSEIHYWDQAEAAYGRWNKAVLALDSRADAYEALTETAYAQVLLWHKKDFDAALPKLSRAETLTKEPLARRKIATNMGIALFQRGDPQNALVQFEHAWSSALNARQDFKQINGWIAQTYLRLGQKDKVRELLESGVDDTNAAELWLAIQENPEELEQARKFALDAYRYAWADGVPYAHMWNLERAEKVLRALNIPVPTMAIFSESEALGNHIPFARAVRHWIEAHRESSRQDSSVPSLPLPASEDTSQQADAEPIDPAYMLAVMTFLGLGSEDTLRLVDKLSSTNEPISLDSLDEKKLEQMLAEADVIDSIQDPHELAAMIVRTSTKNRVRIGRIFVKILGIGGPASMNALIGLLDNQAPLVQSMAIKELADLKNRACVWPLVKLMKKAPASVRIEAIEALDVFADPTAYETLVSALDDPAREVRGAAVSALAEYHIQEAIPLITSMLRDTYKYVRDAAIEAIDKLGGWEALRNVDQLAAYLVATQKWEYAKHLRSEAINVLKNDLAQTRITTRRDAMEGLTRLGWTPKTVEDRANAYFFNEKWDDVAALGTPAIPSLLNALRHSYIASQENPRQHAARLLKQLNWQPGSDEDGIFYYIALENWDKVYSFDKAVAESPLTYVLRRFAGPALGFDTNPPLSAARGLEKLGPSDLAISTTRDVATLTDDAELKAELCRILTSWGHPYTPDDL